MASEPSLAAVFNEYMVGVGRFILLPTGRTESEASGRFAPAVCRNMKRAMCEMWVYMHCIDCIRIIMATRLAV